MISMLFYSRDRVELRLFDTAGREVAGKYSEDAWQFLSYFQAKSLQGLLEQSPLIDLSCVEVTNEDGLVLAEQLRRLNKEMYMILLTDVTVSPARYIRPTVMAGSLLLRPVQRETVHDVFSEAVQVYLKKINDSSAEFFTVDTREEKRKIPYGRILYFESREKKIYINTGTEEYSFYDTLDRLEQELPEAFLRCHRSFIVSRHCVQKVRLSQSLVLLENGTEIPLSRSYKKVFKEFM